LLPSGGVEFLDYALHGIVEIEELSILLDAIS
jgi:hypothetical protein